MQRIRRNSAARLAANRARVDDYLLTHPCVDCGLTDLVVLEFDHVRGVKVGDVSALVGSGYPWAKIEAEIAKCDVRCANCHRRVTVERRMNRSDLAEERSMYAFRDPGAIRTRDRHLRRVLL
jgi:formate-dependent nitrite reductase cytochrome c552 subunit